MIEKTGCVLAMTDDRFSSTGQRDTLVGHFCWATEGQREGDAEGAGKFVEHARKTVPTDARDW